MGTVECVVNCRGSIGDVPRLCHAVMGNAGLNLLRAGVDLQRTLEEICEGPLLRRVMDTFGTGIGVDRGLGIYQEQEGAPVYDFTFFDQIIDVIENPRSIPFMGVGFMPEALSAATAAEEEDKDLPPDAKTRRGAGRLRVDRSPPRDYDRWHDLVHATVRHAVDRYGEDRVSRWYWDFWNEPDLRGYWPGTQEELFKTYDYAAAAIKKALPSARVGGIGTAGGCEPPVFKAFLEHCASGENHCTGGKGAPLDFITFHMKGGPTGSKGIFHDPWSATNYERQHPSLAHIIDATRTAMQLIASVEGTDGLPVFLTECDIDWGTGTSIYHNPNMHYRNSEYFPAFQAALFRRMLDLREEFPSNPIQALFLDTYIIPGRRIFEGQRTLVTAGCIDKPILNGLRLLGKLGERRLAVDEPEDSPVEVVATAAGGGSVQVMAVNYGEPFDYSESHEVRLKLNGLPDGRWRAEHLRIDRDHSNAYTVWLGMDRPVVPTDVELANITERMGLEACEPEFMLDDPKSMSLATTLPPQSVSLWLLRRA